MPEEIVTAGNGAEPEDDDEGVDTEEEFKALFAETEEAKERLQRLAENADKNGKPEIAAIYREVAGTVVTLISDLSLTTGQVILDVENDLAGVIGGEPTESVLLEEDGKLYVVYFEQMLRLFDDLEKIVPDTEDGVAQRDVFQTLRRMTVERLEFTKEIMVPGEEAEPDAPEDPDAAPDSE